MLQLSHGGLGASIDDTHRYNSITMFQVPSVPDSGVGISHQDSSGEFQCLDISRCQVSVRQVMCAHMKAGFQWGTFQKEEQEITAKLLLLSHDGLGASIVDTQVPMSHGGLYRVQQYLAGYQIQQLRLERRVCSAI